MKKAFLKTPLVLAALAITTISCSSDDNDIKQIISDSTGIDITDLTVPSSYEFTRSGETTVSYGGQTTRLKQVAELGGLIGNKAVTLEGLSNRFKGSGFTDASLNDTGKQVRNKTANSVGLFEGGNTSNADAIKAAFDGYLSKYINEVQPELNKEVPTVAAAGQAGIANGNRNVNGDGLEYNQAFYKGLIGALVADQVSNHYLNRLDDNYDQSNSYRTAHDNDEVVGAGKSYTTMEHHWDEAYGYIYGVAANEDVLLQKYINRVEDDIDFKGIAKTINDAFLIGRAAIVAKKYDIRDAAITVIRKKIADVIAIRAIYYLQQAKEKLAARETAFHDLSEGYGFVYSLQFTTLDGKTPIFSKATVDGFIAALEAGNGFWDVTATKLDEISNAIAAKFDFTVAQAGN